MYRRNEAVCLLTNRSTHFCGCDRPACDQPRNQQPCFHCKHSCEIILEYQSEFLGSSFPNLCKTLLSFFVALTAVIFA